MAGSPLLIVGASGFVGRGLLRAAIARDVETVALSRSRMVGGPGFGSVQVSDYTDRNAIRAAAAGCNVAVMLAGLAHVMRPGPYDAELFLSANRDTPLCVAEAFAAAGGRRFLFLSSIAVHGVRTEGSPFIEASPFAPANEYGRSKLAGEAALAKRCAELGLELVIVRPPLVYGPQAPGNFGHLLRAAKAGWPLPFGSVRNRRDFIGIGNLSDLLLTASAHPRAAGEAFLASDLQRTSTAELLQLLFSATGRPRRLLPCPPALLTFGAQLFGRKEMTAKLLDDLEVDGRKAADRLGWRPPISLAEGVRLCLAETAQ